MLHWRIAPMYFHQRISLIAVIPLFTGCALHHTAGGSGIEIIHGGSAVAGPVGSPVAVAEERLQTSCLSVLSQPLSKQLEQQVLNECTLPSRRLRALFPFMRYVEQAFDSRSYTADSELAPMLDFLAQKRWIRRKCVVHGFWLMLDFA